MIKRAKQRLSVPKASLERFAYQPLGLLLPDERGLISRSYSSPLRVCRGTPGLNERF